jgi:hypothetical protein
VDLLVGMFIIAILILVLRKPCRALTGPASKARAGAHRPELSAADLQQTLNEGQVPTPLDVAFRLQPGEECYGVVAADVEQWLEGDGTYTKKYVAWAGGLSGLALGAAINAAGNSRRKAAAAREAAERWRMIGHYRIYITNQRVALEGGGRREWHEIWLQDARRVARDNSSVVIETANSPSIRLHVAPTEYWYTLLRWLVLDELPSRDIA